MNPVAVFDFRYSESSVKQEEIAKWLSSNCKKWCFQLEEGDTGYKHYQGRFSLIKKRRADTVLKLFVNIAKPNYLAPTVGDNKTNTFYVMKEDTRIAGPWQDTDKDNYIPRQYRDLELYPYQQEILDMSKEFDSRHIDIIVDPKGNIGKTTIASIAELKYGCIDVPPINDAQQLIATVCDMCMYTENRSPPIVFIDLPRAMPKNKLQGIYHAIEQIKKGKLYDVRNKYKYYWIDSPHIWVFTNEQPNSEWLSLDRWRFWSVTKHKELQDLST